VVAVDAKTIVPAEFVKNGEIVLNISFDATGNLKMDNDFIHFKARFGGVAREIVLPVENVSAIYARENGQGMAFEVKREDQQERKKKPDAKKLQAAKLTTDNDRVQGAPILTTVLASVPRDDDDKPDPDPPKNHGKPKLTRIK
jgi:stringent starvation protein B